MIAQTGDVHYGLWYPVVIALATVVAGIFMVAETKGRDVFATNADGPASKAKAKAIPTRACRPLRYGPTPAPGRSHALVMSERNLEAQLGVVVLCKFADAKVRP